MRSCSERSSKSAMSAKARSPLMFAWALVRLNGIRCDDAHARRGGREGAEEKNAGEESDQVASNHEAELSRTTIFGSW